jgi:serine/threonine protein kinase
VEWSAILTFLMEENYTKGQVLGQGAFGKVILYTRKADGVRVAVKCVPSNATDGVDFSALREIKV